MSHMFDERALNVLERNGRQILFTLGYILSYG